jgi:hypothetical protein
MKTAHKKKTKRTTTRKLGGSTIYDGENSIIKKTKKTYKGHSFFRKLYTLNKSNPNYKKNKQASNAEIKIVKFLMKHPHPNIVTYYRINKDFAEMEELNVVSQSTWESDKNIIIKTMKKVKEFLQGLGVYYIDWKFDNIGKSRDGVYKLFDFDLSSMMNLHTKKWKVAPGQSYNYKKAIDNGITDPSKIDDMSFDDNLI